MKIADFGLLEFKPVMPDDTDSTGVAGAHNTGFYAAPRNGRYSREDDIWSFACIVSELATSDIQGRDEVARYRNARIADGGTPRFFQGQRVKGHVLERHRQLQSITQAWNSLALNDARGRFQMNFYTQPFFALLNSMFRHKHDPGDLLEVSSQITAPSAGDVAAIIERLRRDAIPARSLNIVVEEADLSSQANHRDAEDLVISLEAALEEFKDNIDRQGGRKSQLSDLPNFKQFLVDLQARQCSHGHQQGLRRLNPFIEALTQFEQLLGEFCEADKFMASIWVKRLYTCQGFT